MGSIGRDVATYLLEVQAVDATGDGLQFGEPAFEAQEAHSAAFEALRVESSPEPLVMWPSLPRSAQPVVVPRSRGEDGRGHGVSPSVWDLTQDPTLRIETPMRRAHTRTRRSYDKLRQPSDAWLFHGVSRP